MCVSCVNTLCVYSYIQYNTIQYTLYTRFRLRLICQPPSLMYALPLHRTARRWEWGRYQIKSIVFDEIASAVLIERPPIPPFYQNEKKNNNNEREREKIINTDRIIVCSLMHSRSILTYFIRILHRSIDTYTNTHLLLLLKPLDFVSHFFAVGMGSGWSVWEKSSMNIYASLNQCCSILHYFTLFVASFVWMLFAFIHDNIIMYSWIKAQTSSSYPQFRSCCCWCFSHLPHILSHVCGWCYLSAFVCWHLSMRMHSNLLLLLFHLKNDFCFSSIFCANDEKRKIHFGKKKKRQHNVEEHKKIIEWWDVKWRYGVYVQKKL